MSLTLPPIPSHFLRTTTKGRPSLAITKPDVIRMLRLAAILDTHLTDADLAFRHGISVPTVRKYTNDVRFARRHNAFDIINRKTREIVGTKSKVSFPALRIAAHKPKPKPRPKWRKTK